MKKVIALIFGGKSAEHEVSLRSAKNVADALDKDQYTPILIGISKEGSWYRFPDMTVFNNKAIEDKALPAQAESVALIALQGRPVLYSLKDHSKTSLDVAFPIMHGTMGEDGTIQGLFKMVQLPFVGCGVWSSAAGMDKEVMKRLLAEARIPNARYMLLTPFKNNSYEEIAAKLGSPFFIKPANAGSSVGVHKIKSAADFGPKLKDAFQFDNKVLAEEFIQGREIECSVMGHNHAPKASLPGEVIPQHEFYSYEAKYVDDNGALLEIPAKLDSEVTKRLQAMAEQTFHVMGCDGLTRVDFFLKPNGELYINEINTIPGFTKISMYPKMWEATGLSYKDLISNLITLAFEKYEAEQKLKTSYLE
ncbi:D-alanine--D-alanine ligase family protein [Bdellovibrio svalbardensis]|uniref:D-alanine--D-alanine ligase n=1 Tax=Bdellovibrio svalbardensis TaxID=2972972 RepID=A0ABT6DJF5_9BACT|nr:D-alanine--D-alanine ligase family protein [Bdellovibrio svalbardensis]MDG0816972.1 D-alanine--D-alanine ligase [Bdellovibrio svalbardensis]